MPFSEHIAGLLAVYGLLALGLFSPGPNILAVVGTAMGTGRRAAIHMALGIALGTGIWASLTVAGLTALLTAYADIATWLRLAGGCFLIWLGLKAYRAALRSDGQLVVRSVAGSAKRSFAKGLAIQLTNPKAMLHWAALMTLAISPQSPLWVAVAVVVGSTALSAIGHVAYATGFSTERVAAAYRRLRRGIEAVLGTFFVFAGARLIAER